MSRNRAYAVDTKVPVDQTKGEIERLVVERHGGTHYAVMTDLECVHIAFRVRDRNLLFRLPLPPPGESGRQEERRRQDIRSRWRGLLLTIKAKFESVERGVETFEEAFLAHTVMPDGMTVADHAMTAIADAYGSGKSVPLLPDMRGGR